MEENKRREDNIQSGQKNYDSSKYHHHFQVKYIPKGLFQLFNKNETSYIYEKKFSCELPKDIIPPKCFHYPFSLEKYCQSDLLTMDFDLKKNPDILTDPKINTFIHQDFINNSLELVFPNLTTISKKRTDEEQNFKKKIIEIIESSEEVEQEFNPVLSEIPDFLRRQTYLRPSTVITNEKKTKIKDKGKSDKKKTSSADLIKTIEQSFNDIDKIKVGMKHPDPKLKGLTAKNVYELSPMETMPNIKFIEYLFPSEPSEVPNLDPKYLKPDHFIITNNMANDINQENTSSLYINNKLETQKDHVQKDAAEYFTYEREFTYSKMTQNDLFNRYFLILDKTKKKLKVSPLSDKISFRRYKKMTEANLNNIENEEDGKGNNNNDHKLKKKRKRDIIIIPNNLEKGEFDEKKKWLNERGYTIGFTERKINEVNHDDVIEIERERQRDEELKMQKMKSDNEDNYENEDNEENAENAENEENEENEFDFDEGLDDENNEEKENLSNKNENEDEQNSEDGKKEQNEESDNEDENKKEENDKDDDKKDKQGEENDEDLFD